jgi:hypothetical protein
MAQLHLATAFISFRRDKRDYCRTPSVFVSLWRDQAAACGGFPEIKARTPCGGAMGKSQIRRTPHSARAPAGLPSGMANNKEYANRLGFGWKFSFNLQMQ